MVADSWKFTQSMEPSRFSTQLSVAEVKETAAEAVVVEHRMGHSRHVSAPSSFMLGRVATPRLAGTEKTRRSTFQWKAEGAPMWEPEAGIPRLAPTAEEVVPVITPTALRLHILVEEAPEWDSEELRPTTLTPTPLVAEVEVVVRVDREPAPRPEDIRHLPVTVDRREQPSTERTVEVEVEREPQREADQRPTEVMAVDLEWADTAIKTATMEWWSSNGRSAKS